MKTLKRLSAYCLLLFSCLTTKAQESDTHSLLWRISGNGLQAPSYLYGTIHLSDERLFHFGDSLYGAILQSDGFAMELDPEQITLYVVDVIKQQMSNSKKLDEILSESDMRKYGPALEKKFHKDPSEITSMDILKEKNAWIKEKYHGSKMQTFMDAYLYDVARREGKWIGGVEDFGDQRGLVNDVVDKSDIEQLFATYQSGKDNTLERMIQAYQKEDIDMIVDMSNRDSASYDRIVAKRNLKMAMRMDSLARVRTMVFAVGAAHLGGNQGLIALLRKKGYKVDPVTSSRRIRPGEITIQEKPLPWETVNDDNNWYQVSMPGKSKGLQLYDVVNMRVYVDLSNNAAYFTGAVVWPGASNNLDSALDMMATRMFAGKKKKLGGEIELNGAKGRMYTIRQGQELEKGYLLIKNNKIFIIYAAVMKESDQGKADIDRFLGSFKILDEKQVSNGLFFHYRDSVNAYELDIPAKPQYMDNVSGVKEKSGISTALYVSVDPHSGKYFLFGTNNVLRGHFIENDSSYLGGMAERWKSDLETVEQDTMYQQGNDRVLEISGKRKDVKQLYLRCRYYLRGNRCYIVAVTYGSNKPDEQIMKYFESFRLMPFNSQRWAHSITPDSVFSAWCPSPLMKISLDSSDTREDASYNAIDTMGTWSYDIVAWHPGPYYWAVSDSSFWAERIDERLQEGDSLIYKRPVFNGSVEGWEFEKVSPGSLRHARYRTLRYGDEIYSVMTFKDGKSINDENTNRFFESLRFQKKAPKTHLLDSRAKLLLNDVMCEDSATRARASDYLYRAPFSRKDLDLIHRTLERTAQNEFGTEFSSSLVVSLTHHIRRINDTSSLHFARDLYGRTADSNADLKNACLTIMASYPSISNFKSIASILTRYPLKGNLSYEFMNLMVDTAELTARIATDLLPLLKNENLSPSITYIFVHLLDSGKMEKSLLTPYVSDVVQVANARIRHMVKDRDSYDDGFDTEIIHLLGYMDNSLTRATLQQYLGLKNNNYLRFAALKELVAIGQSVDPSVIAAFAKNRSFREALYNFLDEKGKLNLMPSAFKSPKSLAESNIWNGLDEDEPLSIQYVGMKQVDVIRQQNTYYFFTLSFDKGKNAPVYLGCSGPFDAQSGHPDMAKVHAEIDLEEALDPSKIEEKKDQLIKRYADVNQP